MFVISIIFISCESQKNTKQYVYVFNGNPLDTLFLFDDFNQKKDEYSYKRKIFYQDSLFNLSGKYYYQSKRICFDNWLFLGESRFMGINLKKRYTTSNMFSKRFLIFGVPIKIYTEHEGFDYFELVDIR